jgi:hypothetical protein
MEKITKFVKKTLIILFFISLITLWVVCMNNVINKMLFNHQ